MTYEAEISRTNPTCFLFLVDQSGSMAERFGAEVTKTKAEGVADAINRLLDALVRRCTRGLDVLDRYHVGVVGYGAEIGLGFPGVLGGGVVRSVSDIANNPLRIESRRKLISDGAGGVVEQVVQFPVWFEPLAKGKTPMCQATRIAGEVIGNFICQHPRCFPPIVINITDGKATDGLFETDALNLWRLASEDGNVLLFNVHISARGERPILFPCDNLNLSDEYARRLFSVSSPLPKAMLRQAQVLETSLAEGARGFAFNADLCSVVSFLDIGTRVGPGSQ
jgi:hypothetical protein